VQYRSGSHHAYFLPSTQRGKVDFFAHNKKKDRLAETAMLYFTLTVSALSLPLLFR